LDLNTIQPRLDEEAKIKLAKYAEFLDCSPSYVVMEALKLVYHKDKEILALRWKRLDFLRGSIEVFETYSDAQGFGTCAAQLLRRVLKSDRPER
jgi:hypothetical protein